MQQSSVPLRHISFFIPSTILFLDLGIGIIEFEQTRLGLCKAASPLLMGILESESDSNIFFLSLLPFAHRGLSSFSDYLMSLSGSGEKNYCKLLAGGRPSQNHLYRKPLETFSHFNLLSLKIAFKCDNKQTQVQANFAFSPLASESLKSHHAPGSQVNPYRPNYTPCTTRIPSHASKDLEQNRDAA